MKHLFNHLPKLAAVAAIALSMSSCNRAEYAMLPKTTPYHATYHGTAKPAPAPVVAAETPVVAEAPAALVKEKITATAAVVAPVAAPAAAEKSATVAVAKPAPTPVATARKLSPVQRLAAGALAKKLEKASNKLQLKQRTETAATSKLQGKLRQGLILVLVGLVIEILAAAVGSSIIYLLGALLILVGLVLIVLYLLDEL